MGACFTQDLKPETLLERINPVPVQWNSAAVIARVRAGAMRGVVRGAHAVQEEAIRLVQDPPKTGRTYRRRGVEHQASAPGEAPASDTGNLAGNITVDEPNLATLTVTVTARTKYSAALEFGTPTIEPRSFMRVALQSKRVEIEADIAAEITLALR